MCGRYAASANVGELIEEFDVEEDRTGEPTRTLLVSSQDPPAGTPDHNMAPTKQAPVVLTRPARGGSEVSADPTRQLRLLTWGLVPSWSKDTSGATRMINARAESVATKPAFAKAVASRRALVPAEGWYEWQVSPTAVDAKGKPRKQPFFIHRADGDLLAMGGIYEFWRDPNVAEPDDPAAWLVSFAVVTHAAEEGLDRIHDRQPLVLEKADWERWLDPDLTSTAAIGDLLAPGPAGRFAAYPIGRAVGSNRANGPGLLLPASRADLVGVVDPMTGEIIGGPDA
ncbi:conserved hypothetical protein [Phycicoccus elongatus Lp2]|uniref:Abasic site processing protein n=1 Tax=Phycicoccus elongatus Lp2 TaxID=1193181 RepID=N0E151_9MICO|nr:SOS response-associated peptidase [Phycicoccus elongatus]CCH69506.1 conserved hypothetical protein [Phycicoccus elongatus Lp2]